MSLINQVLKDIEKNNTQKSSVALAAVDNSAKTLFSPTTVILFLIALSILSYLFYKSQNSQTIPNNVAEIPAGSLEHKVEKKHSSSENKEVPIKNENEDTTKITIDKLLIESNKIVSKSQVKTSSNTISDFSQSTTKEVATNSVQTIQRIPTSQKKKVPNEKAVPAHKESERIKVVSNETKLKSQLQRIIKEQSQKGIIHAIAELEELLASHPNFHAARLQLIKLSWRADRANLENRLINAISINPPQPSFYAAASRFFIEERKYDRTLEILNKYPNVEFTDDLLQVRALTFQKKGDHLSAVRDYQKLINIKPNKDPIYLAMAISLEALGEGNRAKASYQKALNGNTLNDQQRSFIQRKLSSLKG